MDDAQWERLRRHEYPRSNLVECRLAPDVREESLLFPLSDKSQSISSLYAMKEADDQFAEQLSKDPVLTGFLFQEFWDEGRQFQKPTS